MGTYLIQHSDFCGGLVCFKITEREWSECEGETSYKLQSIRSLATV